MKGISISMKRTGHRSIVYRIVGCLMAAACLFAAVPEVRADEADDIQSMIDRARRGVNDLRRLDDDRKAALEDITVLDVWLNEAWRLRSEKRYDESREVLDRVEVQKDMIREVISASALTAEAAAIEAEIKAAHATIKKLKDGIAEAIKKKAMMEARIK